MLKPIEIVRQPRLFLLERIKDLSVEQLNQIPAGFNNNIIWNLAHMISAQQGICYTRAGLPIVTADKYYTPYRPDTKPGEFINAEEVAIIKDLFISTIDELAADLNKGVFVNYPSWTTRYGVEINSIDTAVAFLPFHEGLHCGCIVALKKLVLL